MATFITMLRGINVSGQKKILMADLKKLYEDIGYNDVVTYIQSGNVIFNSSKKLTHAAISKKIEEVIFKKYQFHVPVIAKTLEEIKEAIANNPFIKKKNVNLERLYITFLSDPPDKKLIGQIEPLKNTADEYIIEKDTVYLYCPGGYGETKLSNNFFESKLKTKATTRNWKTVNKLAELAA